MLGDDIAVLVGDLFDEIGRIKVAAVDAGALRREQRDGRDVEVLAEGVARQRQRRIFNFAVDETAGLACGVDTGLLRQAEVLHVLVELVVADAKTDVDERRVAGVGECLRQVLLAVAGRALRAVDRLALDLHAAAAIEARVQVDDIFLKRHRKRQRFERGARLVGIVDGLAAPLLVEKVACVFDDLLLRHAGGQKVVVDRAGGVQIVGRQRRHRQHRAGVDIHDDALGTLAGTESRLKLLHAFLKVILDSRVERRVQIVSVFRIEILVVLVEHGAAVAVACGDDHAVFTGQLVVVRCLKAHRAAVFIGKTDDLRGKRPLGIGSLARRADKNALEIVLVDELAHLVGELVVRLLGKDLVLRVGFFHLFENVSSVEVQNFGKTVCDQVLVLIVFDDLLGGEKDILRRGGHREDRAVFVVDRAAARLHRGAQRLLAHGDGLELVMLGDLPVIELGEEQHKRQHAEHAE